MNRRQHLKLMMAAAGSMLLSGTPYAEAMASAIEAIHSSPGAANTSSTESALTWLRFGDVMPEGWLKEQMRRDLHEGFAGCLDELCEEAAQDIFASGRNTPEHRHAILGNVKIDWWDGETEGNWRTGFLMLSCLSGDEEYRQKADQFVNHILASQDADGYLGIYSGALKYQQAGELWTQACLLRGLLAYAEITKRADVQKSVVRAVDAIMRVYGPEGKTLPFAESHDLMIADVMERLEELTGDPKYAAWGLWMYESWSKDTRPLKGNDADDDTTLPALLDPGHAFFGHGVHVLEHLRIPLWLSATTGREDIRDAARMGLVKADHYKFIGGSVVSMEWIKDKKPDPSLTECEYCTTKEVEHTYLSALQKTGDTAYADRVERVFLNDAQGARTADGSAISYLTSDNRFHCDGRSPDNTEKEPRNKFSPTHRDVAVCCSPMSTQVAPLYVRGMWMRRHDGGLTAMLYGPSTLTTDVKGITVTIFQETCFPMENIIRMTVTAAEPVEFTLNLRDPGWSRGTHVQCAGGRIERVGNYWTITKRWSKADSLTIVFTPGIQQLHASNGEIALSHGALVYAFPLKSVRTPVKEYSIVGFEDAYFKMNELKDKDLAFHRGSRDNEFRAISIKGDTLRPFDSALMKLVGPMVNTVSGKIEQVDFVPLGNAPFLRRVTFPLAET